MRLGDLDALRKKLQARHDNGEEDFDKGYNIGIETAIDLINNAPTVDIATELQPNCNNLQPNCNKLQQPQGEWVRKEDVIHSIAKQYSEHNELVPIWLSIGDMKGGAE